MWGFDNYPPGHPRGKQETDITLFCPNEDCAEFESPREVTRVYERETGGAYIEPAEDEFCEECGAERVRV